MLVAYFVAKKKNYPKHQKSSILQILKSFTDTFWALLMTLIILFGIIGGVFTPTEASVVAVLYALFIGTFVYKKLNLKNIFVVILDSMKTTASLMILVGFANLFGFILITEQIPQRISEQILLWTTNKYAVLLLINLLLILVGTFMETIAALLILFPILLKVAIEVDVEPMHFTVIAVLNLIIGLTTPPVGVCLFVASSIGKTSIGKVSRAGLPFSGSQSFGLGFGISFSPAVPFSPQFNYGLVQGYFKKTHTKVPRVEMDLKSKLYSGDWSGLIYPLGFR